MTERKPVGVSFEWWIDRLIRQGRERGEFDDLPHKGKPLPDIGERDDPDWWIKAKLKREGVSYLPPTLQIRKDAEDAMTRAMAAADEETVRTIIGNLNVEIRKLNRMAASGPPMTLMPFDVDDVVARWRARRAEAGVDDAGS